MPRTSNDPFADSGGRYAQDYYTDPVQFSPRSAQMTNDWYAAHPEEFARAQKAGNSPWWMPLVALSIPVGGGLLAGALGSGAAAGGASGAFGGAVGSSGGALPSLAGIPTATGLPSGIVGAGGIGASGFGAGAGGGGMAINWGNVARNAIGLPGGGTGSTTEQILGNLPSLIGRFGGAANALESGRAQGRLDEASAARDYDRNALSRYNSQLVASNQEANRAFQLANTELAQKQFASNEQERQNKNAVKGGLLMGLQDASISGLPAGVNVPTISGGLRPSAITNRQQIGDAMYRNAITELLDHPNAPTARTTPGTFNLAPIPTAPDLSQTPGANGLDTALNIFGTTGTILDALRGPQQARSPLPSLGRSSTTGQLPSGIVGPSGIGPTALPPYTPPAYDTSSAVTGNLPGVSFWPQAPNYRPRQPTLGGVSFAGGLR